MRNGRRADDLQTVASRLSRCDTAKVPIFYIYHSAGVNKLVLGDERRQPAKSLLGFPFVIVSAWTCLHVRSNICIINSIEYAPVFLGISFRLKSSLLLASAHPRCASLALERLNGRRADCKLQKPQKSNQIGTKIYSSMSSFCLRSLLFWRKNFALRRPPSQRNYGA